MKYLFTWFFLFVTIFLFAQQGKDGAKVISAPNTIVNEYIDLTADIFVNDISIQVSSSSLNSNGRFSANLAAGDLIFIYQTRGATINGYINGWGGNGQPRDSSMGEVMNYNNTGHFEFAEVKNVPDGTTIEVSCPLLNNYTSGLGQTQVIRVPRYSSLTINSGGVLTADAWNGTTGGLQVTEVKGNTVINSGGKIDASGLGFRGGIKITSVTSQGNNEGTDNVKYGGDKGEGISGYQNEYNSVAWNGNDGGGRYGKNSMANGGGAGCSFNAGGGGGANGGNPSLLLWNGRGVPNPAYNSAWLLEGSWVPGSPSTGGGKGGYKWCNTNKDPFLVAPGNVSWGGDKHSNDGGLGGRPVDYSYGIFLGGGGGAGQGDDGYSGAGGNGGGLIYLQCFGTVSGAGKIISNGAPGGDATGTPSTTTYPGKDGAGGGGAGGTILINSVANGITANADGGKGGDQNLQKGIFAGGPDEAQGPGGGGGGGYIAVQSGAIGQTVNGGVNGTTNTTLNLIRTKFPANGATSGNTGSMNQTITSFNILVRDTALCGSGSLTLSASLTGNPLAGTILTWYDAAVGGNVLTTGATYVTPILASTTTYYIGSCPGFFRVPLTVTVSASFPTTINVVNGTCGNLGTVTAIPGGGTAAFTYSWNNGPTGATQNNVTAGNYTVTVKDAGGCVSTSTTSVSVGTALNLSNATVTNPACFGQSSGAIVITPTGGQSPYSYAWTNSATTATNSGIAAGAYTVTITDNSSCTSSTTFNLTAPAQINLTTGSTNAACTATNGQISVSVTGGTPSFSFSWLPGSATSQTVNGVAAGIYTVTVTDSKSCAQTKTVTVGNASTFSASVGSVTDVSCFGGSNGTATVSASNGTGPYTYDWQPGGSNNATQTNLTAIDYTVVASDANGCSSSFVVSIGEPAAIVPTITPVSASCGLNNGSASVTSVGGTPSYSYIWTGGVTGVTFSSVAGGNYTVTVTDSKNCTVSSAFTIGANPGIDLTNSTFSNPLCATQASGSILVAPTGGLSPYTYNWTNTATGATNTGIAAGPYTVTVVDNSGCVSSSTFNLTDPALLVVGTGSLPASCSAADGQAYASVSGGSPGYTYSWSPGAATAQTINGITSGIYTVTVKDINGCSLIRTASVANNSTFSATTNGVTDATCFGLSDGKANVTGSNGTGPYTYSWQPNGSTSSTANNLSAGIYTILAADGNGCSTTLNITIGQPTAISPAFSITPSSCGINNGIVTASATGGKPSYSYSWNGGVTGATISNLAAGNYSLTVTDGSGCTKDSVAIVGTSSGVNLSAVTATNPACFGEASGSITVNPSGGQSPYSYSWSGTGGATGATNSALADGSYTLTVNDNAGCTSSTTIALTAPPAITLTISTLPATCKASDGEISVSPSGGSGGFSFSWSPGNATAQTVSGVAAGSYVVVATDSKGCTQTKSGTVANSGGFTASINKISDVKCFGGVDGSASVTPVNGSSPYTISWQPSGSTATTVSTLSSGTQTVVVSDANGCSTSLSVNIGQPATALSVTISTTNATCNSNNGSAVANVSGGTAGYTYSWTNAATSPTITNVSSGICGTTITDSNGCTTSATATIGQTPPSQPTIAATDSSICKGVSTTLISGGSVSYSWLPVSGLTSTTGSAVSAQPASPTTYTVIATDGNGCTASASLFIDVFSLPTASAGNNLSICAGKDTVLIASGGVNYSWTPALGLSSTNAGTVKAKPASTTTYSVTVTDANACSATSSATVTVNSLPTAAITGSLFVCTGQSTTLTASGGTTYSWSTTATSASATITPPATGNYSVSITDGNGCTNSTAVLLTVSNFPTATAGSNSTICAGASTQLNGGTGLNYTWQPATGLSNSNVPNPTASPPSTTQYTLTVSNASSCSATATVTVTVSPAPTASAGPDRTIILGASTTLNGNGGSAYSWSPASSLDNPAIAAPEATPVSTTTYTLLVTDATGCTSVASVTVVVDVICGLVFVPSAFSPNADGQNDILFVRGNCLAELDFAVFNRWGEQVFSTTDKAVGWDGTFRGGQSETGVYGFYLKASLFDGQKITKKGNISLLR